MRHGEIWTVAGGGDFAGKPRPAVIVQADPFESLPSATVCMFTTNPIEAVVRVAIEPTSTNGLELTSYLMESNTSSVWKSRLVVQIGRLSDDDLQRLNQSLLVFLGVTGTPRS